MNGTRYSFFQYGQAIAALICVAIMHVSDEAAEKWGLIETGGRFIHFLSSSIFLEQLSCLRNRQQPRKKEVGSGGSTISLGHILILDWGFLM